MFCPKPRHAPERSRQVAESSARLDTVATLFLVADSSAAPSNDYAARGRLECLARMLTCPWPIVSANVGRGDGAAEVVALRVIAAEARDGVEGRLVLDAFGDDQETERVGELDGRADDGSAAGVCR